MDVKVTLLWILLCYNMDCLNAETGVAHYKFFSVVTDQRQTDRKTHAYIEMRKSILRRALLRIPLVFFHHVCSINYHTKADICKKTLRFDENGFTVGSTRPVLDGCIKMPYNVRFSTRAQAGTTPITLLTVTCPMIMYRDLETDLLVEVPYIYKMSNASKSNAAVMYVQTDNQSHEIYPLHYIKNISFKKLKSRKHWERSKSLDPLAETEVSDEVDLISEYLDSRQKNSPYVKFARFYSSMNLCGRPRPQKMYLCRRCIQKQFHGIQLNYDLAGYNEDRCKRYDISLSENDQQFEPTNKLLMFRCPPINIEDRYTRNFFNIYFVSSNLEQYSLTLFSRDSQRGAVPKMEANIYELQMVPIVKDVKRQRFLPGPPKIITPGMRTQKSHQEIEDEINSLEGDIRMPSILEANLDAKVVQTKYSEKWLIDRVTISFSKVKRIKLIYQRFTRTYKSIDICSLSIKQKTLLCNEIFKKENVADPKKVKILFNNDTKSVCERGRVKLSSIDEDELETDLFSIWECHGNLWETQHKYFVGKNHLKNAATIYARVTIRADEYFYPHVIAAGINKYGLVKAEIEPKVEERAEGEVGREIQQIV